jgi:protein subunit release factor A
VGIFFITMLKTTKMEKINLEIRDAEGGTDAKLLVNEMVDIYTKAAKINNLECDVVEARQGFAHLCL